MCSVGAGSDSARHGAVYGAFASRTPLMRLTFAADGRGNGAADTKRSAISCGLDQELPFGARDDVSADDDLAGDVDLQLRRPSDFGAHRDHQPLVSAP
jgi:hypothetical protein